MQYLTLLIFLRFPTPLSRSLSGAATRASFKSTFAGEAVFSGRINTLREYVSNLTIEFKNASAARPGNSSTGKLGNKPTPRLKTFRYRAKIL